MGSIKTIIILFCCFENKIYRSIIGWMLLVFTVVSLYAGIYGRQEAVTAILNDPKDFIFEILMSIFLIKTFSKVSTELIETIQSKIE